MPDTNYIEKEGLVTAVGNKRAKVLLLDEGGCSSCHNSLCMLSEAKSRYVDVPVREGLFAAGEEVLVRVRPAAAYRAAWLLYGMPFVLIMTALFGLPNLGVNEGVTGALALLIPVPYYASLYLLRKNRSLSCTVLITKRT